MPPFKPKTTHVSKTVAYDLSAWIRELDAGSPILTKDSFVPISKLCFRSIFAEELYNNEDLVLQDLLKQYFRTQHRLDAIYDAGNNWAYIKARNQLYPECNNGSRKHQLNRASDKLIQLDEAVPFVLKSPSISRHSVQKVDSNAQFTFADVCSAPGGWSYTLLERFSAASGVAMSLTSSSSNGTKSKQGLIWDPRLDRFKADKRLIITMGQDGTGSIYNPQNVAVLTTSLKDGSSGSTFDLFLADGGFLIEDPCGKRHVEHLQESIVSKLIYSELFAGLRVLKNSGNMVIKLFGTCTTLSLQLLYILLLSFNSLHLVKPGRSRLVNEEKYIVARGYKGIKQDILDHMESTLCEWNRRDDESGPYALESLLSSCDTIHYKQCVKELYKLNNHIISASNAALGVVIDKTEELLNRGSDRSRSLPKRKIRL